MRQPEPAEIGRIAFGLIIPRSLQLAQAEWRRLIVLSAVFVFAPAEIYYGAYTLVFRSHALLGDPSIKLFLTLGYASAIVLSSIGSVLSLVIVFTRMGQAPRSIRQSAIAALGAFPAGAALTLMGNAPGLATLLTGPPKTWFAYIGVQAASGLVLLVLNVFIGSAVPAALEEGKGPLRAIQRAEWLSRGRRLRLVPIILAYQVSFWLGFTVLAALGGMLAPSLAAHLGYAWMALVSMPGVAVTAIVYRELRRSREGLSDDELSAVFD